MASILKLLWKMSLNIKCRQVMERLGVISDLLQLLTYKSNYREIGIICDNLIDQVIGYAVGTLSELWKCDHLRPQIKNEAIPQFLKLIKSSVNSLTLAHVCTALGRASTDSECMKMIDEANGFQLVFVLLPSLEVKEFDKYNDFYEAETIIAAIECLTMIIINNPVNIIAYLSVCYY